MLYCTMQPFLGDLGAKSIWNAHSISIKQIHHSKQNSRQQAKSVQMKW